MFKKLVCLAVAAVMLFSLVGCNVLPQYKSDAKAELDAYVMALDEERYNDENREAIMGFVAEGKAAIDEAADVAEVDVALAAAKAAIKAVPKMASSFPSVLEEFEIGDFTEEFFEEYTLILVPFVWRGLLENYLDFYTAFIDDGKLNFLIEVTHPTGRLDLELDRRVFAVIVSKRLLKQYEIGEKTVFETYDFRGWSPFPEYHEPPKYPREWLKEIEEKSVEHKVSFSLKNYNNISWYAFHVYETYNEMAIISSVETLNEALTFDIFAHIT